MPFPSTLLETTRDLLGARSDVKFHIGEDFYSSGEPLLEMWDGPDYFDDDCIYDPCDDPTAARVMGGFITADSVPVGFNVCREISKLISKRGQLVHDQLMPVIDLLSGADVDRDGFGVFAKHQLCLSYLALPPNGESIALHLLDRVPEDCLDGLFLACYRLNTRAIYERVTSNVRRWVADDAWWGTAGGERWQISRMVEKWDATFPAHSHEDIRRLCAFRELDAP